MHKYAQPSPEPGGHKPSGFILRPSCQRRASEAWHGEDGGDMSTFANGFYKSKVWVRCRESYLKKTGGLCERCYAKGMVVPAEIVHHKKWITQENINDPNITLNFDNLMAVCRLCHEEIHHEGNTAAKHRKYEKRYTVDRNGRVTTET